jgi:hypothetical protein
MKRCKKKTSKRRALKGGLIGLFCGIVFFVFAFIIGILFDKHIPQGGIIDNGIKIIGYVPIEFFSYCVDKGFLSKHDAITAAVFVGIWFCFIFSALGCAIALLGSLFTKNDMKNGVDSTA